MVTEEEIKLIIDDLDENRINAIVAYRTINALRNQQRHISQLECQIKNLQELVKK